ncbi:MAG: hypothetical protein H9W81_12635 [Enterococcus sp.]|nr:hypothetical protein [Enterococcus sp.]
MTIEIAREDPLAAINYFMPAEQLVERIETLRVMYAGLNEHNEICGSSITEKSTSWWLQAPEGVITVNLVEGSVVLEVFFGQCFDDINISETIADISLVSALGTYGWEYHTASVADSFIGAFEDITDVLYMPREVLVEYIKFHG